MKREGEAVDFWALIAMIVLGVILGTCALSAFGEKTPQCPAATAGRMRTYGMKAVGEVVNSNAAPAAGWRPLQVQPN